jgi:hypothetical protein
MESSLLRRVFSLGARQGNYLVERHQMPENHDEAKQLLTLQGPLMLSSLAASAGLRYGISRKAATTHMTYQCAEVNKT